VNISEATAFNAICKYLGLRDGDTPVTAQRAVEAFALLAERSSKALMAGISGGQIVSRAERIEKLGKVK
jgi:hypothetical protein